MGGNKGDRTRAAMLVMRYSFEVTDLIERVAGVGTSGNHEVQVLTHLGAYGPTCRQDLIALTGLSRSGVAQLLSRIEQLGLVESHTDLRDHRMVASALTRLGRRRVAQMEAELSEYFMAPNPLVKELLDLLSAPRIPSPTTATTTSLDALGRIASVGARASMQLDSETGISETRQRLAIATLADWGEARPSPLADLLGLTSGGTTYLVDQLESAGIVERQYGTVPTDRRAVVIRLTPSGRAVGERLADIIFEYADELAERLAAAHAPQ